MSSRRSANTRVVGHEELSRESRRILDRLAREYSGTLSSLLGSLDSRYKSETSLE